MGGKPCAKVIIDGEGRMAGAALALANAGAASSKAFKELHDSRAITPEQVAEALRLSEACCDWGETMEAWTRRINEFYREISTTAGSEYYVQDEGGGDQDGSDDRKPPKDAK